MVAKILRHFWCEWNLGPFQQLHATDDENTKTNLETTEIQ